MISRRIIRVKVMQILYALYNSEEKSINKAEKELFFSINKSYDLYHLMMMLLVDFQNLAKVKMEMRMNRNIPSHEDLNPNTRFVDNQLINKLRENVDLQQYQAKNKVSWVGNPDLVKKLYKGLVEQDFYKEYMQEEETTFKQDVSFVEKIYVLYLLENEELINELEEQSIYWNDDYDFVISMVIKTIYKFKAGSETTRSLLPLFKDDEDHEFTKNLFRKCVLEAKDHRAVIDQHLRNWDLDRVAFIDVLLMEMAICEFISFPSIPTKVTLNEYIDLSKYYSTSKSSNFINGILDKILKTLRTEGKIKKAGRGLIGEIN